MMNEATPKANFPTTHWSRVARALDPAALAELCAAYWYPIYALIRRKGHSPDQALDLTQDEAPALLHFGAEQSQPVLLVRLEQPDSTAPSQ